YTATSGTVTFAPGVTQQVISVAIATDQVFEQNEHFLLNLGTPVGASPGPDHVQGTIIDVVPLALLGFTTNQFSQPEGSSGTTNFLFTATLSSPTTVPVVVTYTTQNGTATAPSDYVAQSGTFTFAPGETSKVITIAVVGDTVIEGNETFSLTLSSTSAPVTGTASPATATATATITNDDGTPLLFISNASAAPGTSNANAVFTVTLSTTTTENVIVGFATQDFTAIANEDYLPQSGNLTFTPGGSLTQFITVPVLGQLSATLDETFFVNLSSVSPNAEIGDAQGVGTIFRQGISVGDVTLLEGDAGTKAAVFTVNLSQPQGHNVTLHYATADGTATAGSDYTATSGDITFSGNDTIKTVTVLVTGDTTVEGNETFFLNLSNANGAAIIDGQATGTIQNDDGTLAHVRLQIGDAQGNPLQGPLDPNQNFTLLVYVQDVQLTPTGVFQAFVDVNYDKNLVQFTGPISFGPDFPVPAGADTSTAGLLNEVGAFGPIVPPANPGDEKLFFSAPFKAINVGLANFSADAGDLPDHDFLEYGRDTPIPPDHLAFDGTSVNIGHNILSVNNISQSESSGDFVFTVTRILPDPNDATVVFHTADGTATAASGDYVPTTGTLTFTAEQTTKTVTVHVNNDTLDEPDETFQLVLSDAVGATASTSPGIATIVDDDGPVVVNIAGATGDEGQNLQFTVTLASVSGQTVIVPFNTASSLSGNIATAGSDYDATSGAVTFAPGVTQQVISVHALNDIVAEPSETFRVVLGQPVNAVVGVGTATGTIIDLPPATITGFVYVDLNKNGIKDGSETGIQGVMVTATGANGFSQTVLTDATGAYSFVGLVPGIYTVTETQPGFYTDGRDLHNGVESPVNDSFTNIVLAASATAGGYNFGELGIRSDFVATFLNRRALFATAVVTGEWGPQISTSSTVNPRTGDIWISFDGGWTGMRTIDALFDGALGTATMTLYDNAKNAVAVSSPTGTGAQLQFNGTSGLPYFLRVSGTNPSVQIHITDSGPTATATAATDTSSTSSGNTNLRAGMLASSSPTATPQAQTSPSATDPVWSEDADWIGDATV
ncbi:MAG TPA: Calx-beta domain-containing protein, partial [Pirellulales bacterium]|nr:Calx-beta domain-containing protein [Pirellulales bacterium]